MTNIIKYINLTIFFRFKMFVVIIILLNSIYYINYFKYYYCLLSIHEYKMF